MTTTGWSWQKDTQDAAAKARGHNLTWTGQGNNWSGTCGDCGANVVTFPGGTSSRSTRDVRDDQCAGEGTAILTELEDGRYAQLVAQAADRFEAELDEGWDEPDCGGEELEL